MSNTEERKLSIIDSHTGGEPTRVVVQWPDDVFGLHTGSLSDRKTLLAVKYDWIRTSCIHEPRGHDAMVGALLCQPVNPNCVAGVIFFNNVGYLNSCIHGTIGLTVTLAHMGAISIGKHQIETPIGEVTAELHEDGSVTVANVPSYRYRAKVAVEVDGYGTVVGDIAWGGNWFFLLQAGQAGSPQVTSDNIPLLTQFTSAVSKALRSQHITGANDMEVDHIEVFGAPTSPLSDSRNFVLCPGLAYDRSPCGTGTSAKLACLYADGQIKEGEVWRQASILDTIFEGRIKPIGDGRIIPYVSSTAYVNSKAQLIFQENDIFKHGISSQKKNQPTN